MDALRLQGAKTSLWLWICGCPCTNNVPLVDKVAALPPKWMCARKLTTTLLRSTRWHLKTFHRRSLIHEAAYHPKLHQEQPRHLQSCPIHCTVWPRSVLSGYAVELGTTPVKNNTTHRVPAAVTEVHGLTVTWAYDVAACSNLFSACRHSACLSHTLAWLNNSVWMRDDSKGSTLECSSTRICTE